MLEQKAPPLVDDEAALERWAQRYRATRESARRPGFTPPTETLSGLPVEPLYTPAALQGHDYGAEIGYPGEFPYTRGVYPSMYRDKVFTMRQFAGFGTAAETNQRYRFLLAQGQTGLSVAFDMPTLMGRDSDDPLGEGEVGRCGVAIDSLEDMERLFDGIDLGEVTTSMTINSPAAILLAMYVGVAERQGVPVERLGGTLQNDILKEYIAQKEYIYPPHPSLRLVTDVVAFCARNVPRWHPISISGYHIREAGSTAAQELAFTLADGFAYVEAGIAAGLLVDDFAPQLSFFFNSHIDFFEEIAKYRAARRIWARRMRDRYHAQDQRSWLMRFHTQTAGCSLTAQQVENNVARTALEALAAVLGGTQSLHTNAMDEVLSLPTAKAAQIALRTQQIIAYETGVTTTIDPLGGSYFVEDLTNRMEAEAERYFAEIDDRGGVLACIEDGFFQREIADAAFRYQQQLDQGERIVVGVNAFQSDGEEAPQLLRIDQTAEVDQKAELAGLRSRRDGQGVANALDELRSVARGDGNLMLPILDCVRSLCTEGEIVGAMQDVFGTYRESASF
ncbi:MAG: acyl-CoA mutase large subunit family protein [Candidatus Dormibacteria bacterium]